MTDASPPFQAHLDLLQCFLARRDEIVERIQALLNAQRKPAGYLRGDAVLSRHFEDCFFIGVTESQSRLRGQLEAAHRASGFQPRPIPGLQNAPADPAVMMTRAFHLWAQTRWPGRNGRVRYAHTLFNLYVVRCLELLIMRIWDDGEGSAGDRLTQVQHVLDRLWSMKTPEQPVLVRDARWLMQTAQSLATDDLGAYFTVAERITASLSEEDRIEIHRAGVRMAGGHLRSQVRYHATKKGASLDETGVILSTRDSNALDFALLVQELVPLLETYEAACERDDRGTRLELADAICQGISPDPDLFLNRVELLAAYTMIEPLFVATDADGQAVYTPMGQRHVRLVGEYAARIGRVAKPLLDDCPQFRPVVGSYSPYGALYGFSADLVKHMALKASQPDADPRFGLEDVFVAGGPDKLAWVNGWRKLPHVTREVERQFEYPQPFAEDVFARIEHALHTRVSGAGAQAGRLVIAEDADLPIRYVKSSDPENEPEFLADRREGKFVVSYRLSGGWVGITKSILTEVIGTGRDAKIAGLPASAAGALRLMCTNLVVTA